MQRTEGVAKARINRITMVDLVPASRFPVSNCAPATPTVTNIDGGRQLKTIAQTFNHAMNVFTEPGSAENCLLWPTTRD